MTSQATIDFQPYLAAILTSDDYQDWQDCYTPTTVEDRWLVATHTAVACKVGIAQLPIAHR